MDIDREFNKLDNVYILQKGNHTHLLKVIQFIIKISINKNINREVT